MPAGWRHERAHPWTTAELATLRALWRSAPQASLEAALAPHTWLSIVKKASDVGLSRQRPQHTSADPVIAGLRAAREARGETRAMLSARLGYDLSTIQAWERGRHKPKPASLRDWAAALGVPLVQPSADRPTVPTATASESLSSGVPG